MNSSRDTSNSGDRCVRHRCDRRVRVSAPRARLRCERRQEGCRTQGHYYKGMAVFTIAKGGLMYQAAIAGQKFTFKPLSAG